MRWPFDRITYSVEDDGDAAPEPELARRFVEGLRAGECAAALRQASDHPLVVGPSPHDPGRAEPLEVAGARLRAVAEGRDAFRGERDDGRAVEHVEPGDSQPPPLAPEQAEVLNGIDVLARDGFSWRRP